MVMYLDFIVLRNWKIYFLYPFVQLPAKHLLCCAQHSEYRRNLTLILSAHSFWYLLRARRPAGHWECSRELIRDPCLHGAYVLVGKRELKWVRNKVRWLHVMQSTVRERVALSGQSGKVDPEGRREPAVERSRKRERETVGSIKGKSLTLSSRKHEKASGLQGSEKERKL